MVNWDFIAIVAGYAVSCLLGILVINFMTQGFVFTYLKAKAGRGAKALVKIYSITGVYWRVGNFDGNDIVYTPRGTKHKKRLTIPNDAIGRLFNVPTLEVDEKANAIKKPDFTTVVGFDAEKADLMVEKAIMLPRLDKNNYIIVIIIMLVVVILGLAYLGYSQHALKEMIGAVNVITGATTL